jgi:hypothetical protein
MQEARADAPPRAPKRPARRLNHVAHTLLAENVSGAMFTKAAQTGGAVPCVMGPGACPQRRCPSASPPSLRCPAFSPVRVTMRRLPREYLRGARASGRASPQGAPSILRRPGRHHAATDIGAKGCACRRRGRNRIGLEGGQMAKIWGLSKRDAEYGPAPTPDVRCDRCKYMFPPLSVGGCRVVRGVISGSSSCKEFAPRRPARTDTES